GEVLGVGIGNKHDVQIRTVINFGAAKFAQTDDGQRRSSDFVPAHDDFKGVLQAGIGQGGKFSQVLLEIGQAKNVAQANAHQFGLMIAAQPQVLVGIAEAVPQIAEGLGGGLALSQAATRYQFVHEVGGANRQFGQKLGTVE